MTDERLLIDKFALDEELIDNPSLVHQVCEECAEAIAVRDAKKEDLETTDAELDAEIREILSTTSSKITENVVKGLVQTHARHQKAFKEYNDAKLTAAKATALERAVNTRSEALEQLSRLYSSGYFAINHTKRSTDDAKYNEHRKQLAAARKEFHR
jgi:regulator of replication initiation timing